MNKIERLLSALQLNDIKKVTSLLQPGFLYKPVNVNEILPDSKTFLMIASEKSNAEIVRLLINKGASVLAMDKEHKTPLMYSGSLQVAEILINAGANINAETDEGKTVLMITIESGNPEIVKLLIDSGANVNAVSKRNKPHLVYKPFLGMVEEEIYIEDKSALVIAIEKGSESIVNYILDKKPDLDWANRYGETALSKATKKFDEGLTKRLLDAGAKTDLYQLIYDLRGTDQSIRLKFIRLFLESGLDINTRYFDGSTALMKAVEYPNSLRVVQFLVENGADVNLKDNNDETVLFHFANYGNLDSLNTLEYLCAQGLNVNVKNKQGNHPVIGSVYALYAFTRVLLQAGIKYIPGDSHELFIKAIQNNDIPLVELLLKNGADLEWHETRQGEDEWGRYSANDNFNMLETAKAYKTTEIVALLERYMNQ